MQYKTNTVSSACSSLPNTRESSPQIPYSGQGTAAASDIDCVAWPAQEWRHHHRLSPTTSSWASLSCFWTALH